MKFNPAHVQSDESIMIGSSRSNLIGCLDRIKKSVGSVRRVIFQRMISRSVLKRSCQHAPASRSAWKTILGRAPFPRPLLLRSSRFPDDSQRSLDTQYWKQVQSGYYWERASVIERVGVNASFEITMYERRLRELASDMPSYIEVLSQQTDFFLALL